MKVYRTGSDRAAARQRDLRLPESGEQRSKNKDRRPHRAYEFVWRFVIFDLAAVEDRRIVFQVEPGPEVSQEPPHRPDVPEVRYVSKTMFPRRKQGCRHNREGGIF